MRNISITKKLILYFSLFCIGPVIVVSVYSFYNAKNALLTRTFDQLQSVRAAKKNQVERFFNDRITDSKIISNSLDVLNLLYFFDHNSGQPGKNGDNNLFSSVLSECNLIKYLFKNHYYQSLLICNKSGKLACISVSGGDSINKISFDTIANYLLEDTWKKVCSTRNEVIGDFKSINENSAPVIYIASPLIFKSGELEGMSVLVVPLQAINAIMLEENTGNGLGKSGESYLVGSDYLMRSTSRFYANSVLKVSVKTESAREAFAGKPGIKIINEYRNIKVLSSYGKVDIPQLNWAIIAEIDYREAMIPIYKIRNNIILISILITLLMFIIVFYASKRVMAPVIKLKNAVLTIGKGNLETVIEKSSNDEIGELTDAFNMMTSQLLRQSAEIAGERMKSLRSMIDGQEMERQRLSRELHDGLGQSLVAVKLKIESAENAGPDKVKKIVDNVRESFNQTIDDIRRISNDLMPAGLEEFGVVTAIKNLCDSITGHSAINIMFDSQNIPGDLHKTYKIYLFRIVQEALNNIIKHSGATEAGVNLFYEDGQIKLIMEDNGKGFDPEERSSDGGMGLYNMKERVNLLDGTIEYKSVKNKGTIITVRIPYK